MINIAKHRINTNIYWLQVVNTDEALSTVGGIWVADEGWVVSKIVIVDPEKNEKSFEAHHTLMLISRQGNHHTFQENSLAFPTLWMFPSVHLHNYLLGTSLESVNNFLRHWLKSPMEHILRFWANSLLFSHWLTVLLASGWLSLQVMFFG